MAGILYCFFPAHGVTTESVVTGLSFFTIISRGDAREEF